MTQHAAFTDSYVVKSQIEDLCETPTHLPCPGPSQPGLANRPILSDQGQPRVA